MEGVGGGAGVLCRWSTAEEARSGEGEDGERGVDGADVLGEWPFNPDEVEVEERCCCCCCCCWCWVSVQTNHSSIVSTRIDSLQMLYAFPHRSSIPPRRHADARVARAFALVSILLAW